MVVGGGGGEFQKLFKESEKAGGVHANKNISTEKSVGVNFYF